MNVSIDTTTLINAEAIRGYTRAGRAGALLLGARLGDEKIITGV